MSAFGRGRHRDILQLLDIGEASDFIDLDALGREAAYMLVMVGRTGFAGIDHKPDDDVLACTRQARHGPD